MFTNYSDLPLIKIVDENLSCSGGKSYGLIIKCLSTHRWFMVKRKDSNAYLSLIWGSYERYNLVDILTSLNQNERENIKLFLEDESAFKASYIELVEEYNESSYLHSYSRLLVDRDTILPILTKFEGDYSKKERQWLWPKGQPLRSENNNYVSTAIREFLEESGLSQIPSDLVVIERKMLEIKYDNNYRDIFWAATVDEEFKFEQPTKLDKEVSERAWFYYDEVVERLPSLHISILEKALAIIN